MLPNITLLEYCLHSPIEPQLGFQNANCSLFPQGRDRDWNQWKKQRVAIEIVSSASYWYRQTKVCFLAVCPPHAPLSQVKMLADCVFPNPARSRCVRENQPITSKGSLSSCAAHLLHRKVFLLCFAFPCFPFPKLLDHSDIGPASVTESVSRWWKEVKGACLWCCLLALMSFN